MAYVLVVLGGGDEVGASSFFIQIYDSTILLDCGARQDNRKYPFFDYLIEKKYIKMLSEVDIAVISHAHWDHFGALPYIVNNSVKKIISTMDTKDEITKLIERTKKSRFETNNQYVQFKNAVLEISPKREFEAVVVGELQVQLIPAGHSNGAVMTLIISGEKKILYTGDFSFPLSEYSEINKKSIEKIKNCDCLIIEGTYSNSYKDSIMSKHAQFDDLMELIKLVYPKIIYIVHHNNGTKLLVDEVERVFPSIRVVETKTKGEYLMEELL